MYDDVIMVGEKDKIVISSSRLIILCIITLEVFWFKHTSIYSRTLGQ